MPTYRFPKDATDLVPLRLCKYFAPSRLEVLTNPRLRISQRQVVNDPQDFAPPVSTLGTQGEVFALLNDPKFLEKLPGWFPSDVKNRNRS